MRNVALRANADIIASAAALIGFAPTNSVVAYMLRNDPTDGPLVRCAIRFDVTIATEQAANFPDSCNLLADENNAAILLVICDPSHDAHARVILDALRDALEAAGIPVIRRLLTRDVTTAGQWQDLDNGQRGPTYPYTDSILTAQRVRAGDRVSRSRSDIEREFDPTRPAAPVAVGDHGKLVERTTEEIAQILAGSRVPSSTLATRAGILITGHPALRDAMVGMALEHAQLAADLWTQIARQLRRQPRAEALTLAAVCYCLNDDTVRAGIAIDAVRNEAQQAGTPTPRLADLLTTALQSGISPTEIRNVLTNIPPTSPTQH